MSSVRTRPHPRRTTQASERRSSTAARLPIIFIVSSDPGVAVVGTFPESSHPPIIYPIAITSSSKNADTQAYFDFLKSAKAVPFFEHEGFTVTK